MSAHELSRRHLLATAAVAGIAVANLGSAVGNAQSEANVPGATPVPSGPPIPPEFTDAQTNWAVEGGNLKATRQALGSNINVSNVGQLGVGWRAPVTVPGLYGALTANPVIVGDVVYVQDANSNVYAWKASTGEVVWT